MKLIRTDHPVVKALTAGLDYLSIQCVELFRKLHNHEADWLFSLDADAANLGLRIPRKKQAKLPLIVWCVVEATFTSLT